MPVYDKPMIYYPLSVLMLAGIKDILIISTPTDLPNFEKLLGNGSEFGVNLSYAEQPSPDGLAQAFIIGEDFIGEDSVAMILGDNIYYGNGFTTILKEASRNVKNGKATIFGYYVHDPEIFEKLGFEIQVNAISSEEYPTKAKRPMNSRLSKNNTKRAGVERLPRWEDVLERYLQAENLCNEYGGVK